MDFKKKDFIFSDIKKLKGVGVQLAKYLKNKRIESAIGYGEEKLLNHCNNKNKNK